MREEIEGEPSKAERIEAEREGYVRIRCIGCGAHDWYPREKIVGYGAVVGITCRHCGGWFVAEPADAGEVE